jgi:cell division protease FtsH
VSDVNEVQSRLRESGVNKIKVIDVPEESWFLTTLLPTLMIVATILFVFFLMNRPTGANA